MRILFAILGLFAFAYASDVLKADSSNFDEIVGQAYPAFVEFYAPWCGHCKNLAPEYEIVATSFKGQPVKIVAVDADANKELASRFGVTGYPTLKFFPARSLEPEAYQGGRQAGDIIDFINTKVGTTVKVKTTPSSVTVLDPSNFDKIVNDPKKNVLVEFYAPWCGHCKQLAPTYEKLGAAYAGEEDVVIAKLDSDAHRDLASQYDVSGYPTIKFFPKNNKAGEDYNGGRSLDDFVQFINQQTGAEKLADGSFLATAGRLPTLDALVLSFKEASTKTEKEAILKQVEEAAQQDEVKDHKNAAFSKFYTLTMKKSLSDSEYATKEVARLTRLLTQTVKASDAAQFSKRKNIVSLFI